MPYVADPIPTADSRLKILLPEQGSDAPSNRVHGQMPATAYVEYLLRRYGYFQGQAIGLDDISDA